MTALLEHFNPLLLGIGQKVADVPTIHALQCVPSLGSACAVQISQLNQFLYGFQIQNSFEMTTAYKSVSIVSGKLTTTHVPW